MKQHDGSMCTFCCALIGDACGKMVRLAIQQGELGEPIPGGSSHVTGVTREGRPELYAGLCLRHASIVFF